MEEIIRNGAVFGGLLALPLLCWRTRWRHTTVFLGLVLVLGLVLGLWWEVLGTGWREGGPIRALALLLGWVAFTRLASQAGGPRLRGPSWIVAPLLGALVGDWGAALLLAPIAPSNRVAGRWVLGAMAGALLLPHGTPAVLLIASPASLGWLPAILWLVAAPPGNVDHKGDSLVTALLCFVAVASWMFPGALLWALVAAVMIMTLRRGASTLLAMRSEISGFLLLGGLVWLARHSGAIHELRWALEFALSQGAALGGAAVALGAALAAALAGEAGMALVLSSALDTGAVGGSQELPSVLAAGLAVGGIGPLVLTGTLRPTLGRWLFGLALAVGWCFWRLQ